MPNTFSSVPGKKRKAQRDYAEAFCPVQAGKQASDLGWLFAKCYTHLYLSLKTEIMQGKIW